MRKSFVLKSSMLVALWVLLNGASAAACSCVRSGPPCQAYASTSAVFAGTPTGVEDTKVRPGEPWGGSEWPMRVFTFRVTEAFRGVEESEVQVRTGRGGGDCGYKFKIGEAYLVYAHRNEKDGKLYAGICGRTRPLEGAGEDLEYIRGLPKRAPGATLSGTVERFRRDLETEQTERLGPLRGVEIIVEGDGAPPLRARTDDEGRYSLSGLKPGRYTVRPVLPKELNSYDLMRSAVLADRGCAVVDFHATDNGRIAGRVTDSEGRPVARIMVDLIPLSQASAERPRSMFAQTDEEGRYELKFVPPGSYLLGIRLDGLGSPDDPEAAFPRTYYPGAATAEGATVVRLGAGEALTGADIRLLPRLTPRAIGGVVVFPDGRPAAGAGVAFRDTAYNSPYLYHAVTADAEGRFLVKAYEGLTYVVRAHVNAGGGGQRHAEPVEVPAAGHVGDIKLIIVNPGGTCARCRAFMTKRAEPAVP